MTFRDGEDFPDLFTLNPRRILGPPVLDLNNNGCPMLLVGVWVTVYVCLCSQRPKLAKSIP